MGSGRIAIALSLLLVFMISYSWILIDFMYTRIADPYEMIGYILRMDNFKIIIFSSYAVSNCIMTRSCHTRFENELLLTGMFSLFLVCLQTLLHYTHILIMPTQWNLILFNGTTIAFFLVVYMAGRRNGLFKDNG